MTDVIKVDIWSDIACPWCYIGKRKFEAGLAQFAGKDNVKVEYHSFELSPDTPIDFEGSAADFLANHKGLPLDQVNQMLDRVTGIASEVGLNYDYDNIKQTKTLKAHELLHLAKSQGKQLEMKERLLKGYFEQGAHVGKIDTLVSLAQEVGLDAEQTRVALESGAYAQDVQEDIDQARAFGINGVPFFVFDNKYGVSGAQGAETFTQVLEQVSAERSA